MGKINVSGLSVLVLVVLYAGFFVYGYNAELLICDLQRCVEHGARVSNGFIYGFLAVPIILLTSGFIYNA